MTTMRVSQTHAALAVTTAVFLLLFGAASILYYETGFFSLSVFLNFLSENAVVGIAAIGMTFVILSGGIDLSVGAMVGFTTVLIAVLLQKYHLNAGLVIVAVLLLGTLFGAGMGCLIHFFDLAPFLVTLAGMFLLQGSALLISEESIGITNAFFDQASQVAVPLRWDATVQLPGLGWTIPLSADASLRITALLFLPALAAAVYLGSYTRFGRNIYAVGGNENSASLMGLPVGATKVGVYALSGLTGAFAGIASALYMPSGNALTGVGMELDVIAAVVIGGTLLTGGVGHVLGTLIGVLILGVIRTAIDFNGQLSTWWTKIAVGLLVFIFVILQRFLAAALRPAKR